MIRHEDEKQKKLSTKKIKEVSLLPEEEVSISKKNFRFLMTGMVAALIIILILIFARLA